MTGIIVMGSRVVIATAMTDFNSIDILVTFRTIIITSYRVSSPVRPCNVLATNSARRSASRASRNAKVVSSMLHSWIFTKQCPFKTIYL